MAIFDGRYSWDGTKDDNREPISWFPGAYDIKIINLSLYQKAITHLKPYLCIFTNTGKGYSVSANPEKFAKRICEEFSLKIDKVIWVEQTEIDSDNYDIITFKKRGQLGENTFYSMEKRNPMPNELNIIKKEIYKKNPPHKSSYKVTDE